MRNAFDVVASAVGRSHFSSGEATSALKMFTEIIREEMVPQLERIDSAFYRHLDYDRLPSAVPHDLGEWLGFGQSGNPPRGFREEVCRDRGDSQDGLTPQPAFLPLIVTCSRPPIRSRGSSAAPTAQAIDKSSLCGATWRITHGQTRSSWGCV